MSCKFESIVENCSCNVAPGVGTQAANCAALERMSPIPGAILSKWLNYSGITPTSYDTEILYRLKRFRGTKRTSRAIWGELKRFLGTKLEI